MQPLIIRTTSTIPDLSSKDMLARFKMLWTCKPVDVSRQNAINFLRDSDTHFNPDVRKEAERLLARFYAEKLSEDLTIF